MKSENKLNQVIFKIETLERYQDATTVQNTAKEIKTLLREFIIDNTGSSKTKFNLHNYTDPKDFHAYTRGICYDTRNKCAVATDAHILVVDTESYDPTIEERFAGQLDKNGCVIVDKYGNVIDEFVEYPDYNRVFPTEKERAESKTFQIDIDELNEHIKRNKAYIKTNIESSASQIIYQVGDAFYRAELLLSFLIATDGNITVIEKNNNGFFASDNRRAVLMPIVPNMDKIYRPEEGILLYRNWYN